MINISHSELCQLGAKHLKKNGLIKWHKPKYIIVEIESVNIPQPDIYGFGGCLSQQIEVKVSRSDFLADKKKSHRIRPNEDVGQLRSYLCPEGLIRITDLPKDWGLLYIDDNLKIYSVELPSKQLSDLRSELTIISSIMRRIEIKPQIFSFKNHK